MLHGHHFEVFSSITTILCRVDALVGVLLPKWVLGLVFLCWQLLCQADVAGAAGCGYHNVCSLQTEAVSTSESAQAPAQCASMTTVDEAITAEVSTK